MGKNSSFATNSWWNHRMVGNVGRDRDIEDYEDKRQNAYLKKLEESLKPSRKISKSSRSPRK